MNDQILIYQNNQSKICDYFKNGVSLTQEEVARLNHVTFVFENTNIKSQDKYRYELVKNKR